MEEFRPLREVFDELVAGGDAPVPGDLSEAQLADALVGYCDTAPVEVAEHLEGFTTAVTAHQAPPVEEGLELLASAPAPEPAVDEPAGEAAADDTPADDQPGDAGAADLDFGTGTREIDLADLGVEPAPSDADPAADPERTDDLDALAPAGATLDAPTDWWDAALVDGTDDEADADGGTPEPDDA